MKLVRLGVSLKGRRLMLRLVLLLLYLFAASSHSQEKQGGSLDPLGFTASPQSGTAEPTGPSDHTDQGGSLDPLG
jgi:hypothetical protein